jgi:uncharacterized protein RhaS with RHS repeats
MQQAEKRTRLETIFYDADGKRTTDKGLAVRGEAVEVDASGKMIRSLRVVSRQVKFADRPKD